MNNGRICRRCTLTLLFLFLGGLLAEQAVAQFFVFGKNRVQYEAFDWRYIETEHFDIYYYDEKNYHLAQFTAESVESGLQQLSQEFNHTLTDRIPVIIYDSHSDFSQTNVVDLPSDAQGIGGVTDKYKNRMTQPFMGDYADFRRTLHHELLHAFVNDLYYGGGLQAIMANNIQLVLPLWFEEGLAEYLALGWDTQTDMYIRDSIINNYLPSLQRLSGFFSYRGGQAFWNFIEEEYGRAKITEILQRVRQTRSVEQALTQSTGLSLEQLNNRWKDHLQRRYFPEVAERNQLSQYGELVTQRGERQSGSYNTSPAISPMGDRIAFISNRRGVFDIVVIDALTGEFQKTLVRGEDSPMFEELNILNPNLAWSPDGRKVAVATKSQGAYHLGIVDYESEELELHSFEDVDALSSMAWSPDGEKIAFDGNRGGLQSIYVYNLQEESLRALTPDVFTDKEPAWSPDSNALYFISNRGDRLQPEENPAGYSILQHDFAYHTDLYHYNLSDGQVERMTRSENGSVTQPATTREGQVYYISDLNGISNIYEFDPETGEEWPITNVRTGITQISVSSDGSRLVFNGLQDGNLDIFLMRNPSLSRLDEPLSPNDWAQRRAEQPVTERIPATGILQEMLARRTSGNQVVIRPVESPTDEQPTAPEDDPVTDTGDPEAEQPETDETDEPDESDEETDEETDQGEPIDFRNYVFGEEVVRDSTLELRDDPEKFEPTANLTEDGRYQPREYRLTFSPDITYAAGQIDTYYGGAAFAMLTLSDLLGDHRLSLGTNLVFDLRDSDYILQYGYYRNRSNYLVNVFHQSRNYQTFFGELLRFRTYGAGMEVQYPFNRFERLDYGASWMGISRDFSSVSLSASQGGSLTSETSTFFYPQVTYTADYTIPGFITPRGGRRYSIRLSGSPPVLPDSPSFASILGDYRRYVGLGGPYSLALRATGSVSYGPDSQTYFMGGMLGWINQRWSDIDIPFDRLADTFFTQPATPLRGHEFNTLYGDRFALINTEFRFPLFAAILPGPIPILPFYNLTGVAFTDVGSAWGFDINYSLFTNAATGEPVVYHQKPGSFQFRVAKREEIWINPSTGLERDGQPQDGDIQATYLDGDVLIGSGFGLRAIFLGLPFRYDIGWAYDRDGFRSKPIHYFSIGIDF
ncbi:MAG: peptidase MA family metallohydrolase [Bacteroidota bacterium]